MSSKSFWNIRRHLVEIKIGTFFLVAFFLLFFTLLSIRELTFFKGTYQIKVQFDFAEGLRRAAPVRFCGVDVGEVKQVRIIAIDGRPKVEGDLKIQNGIEIPDNAYFFINSLSLFGEKYLEITPPGEEITGYLKEGDVVEGLSPIPLFNVFATFDKTMKEVSAFVREGKIKASVENILSNVEDITLEFKGLLTDIKSEDGTFGKLIYDDTLYLKFTEFITALQNEKGTIGKLLTDDSLYIKAEEFVEDLKKHPWKLLHRPREKKR